MIGDMINREKLKRLSFFLRNGGHLDPNTKAAWNTINSGILFTLLCPSGD